MHKASPDKAADGLRAQVFEERLGIFYRSLPLAILAVVINSALITFALWSERYASQLLAWCGATLLVSAYRGITIIRFRRREPTASGDDHRIWYRETLFGAVLSGAVWGSAGLLFFDPQNTLNLSLLAFVLAGMCAGSIVSMSAFAEASIAFIVLSLLPFLYRLLGQSEPQSLVMALMVLLYMIMMTSFSRRMNATVVSGIEMQQARTRAEETIERQAFFDELTGLPNRRLLKDRLAQSLARARRHKRQAAVLFLDLDFFKRVNDSLGHSAGDQLLIQVGERMRGLLRNEDSVARLGGDEFVALITDIEGNQSQVMSLVRRRAEELRCAIEEPFTIMGNQVYVTVSIGVSLMPADTDAVDDLLKHADTAMYRAKEEGRNTLRFFVADMQKALTQRVDLESRLRSALDRGEDLRLFLHPQYDRDLQIRGAELLLRWEHEGRFIPPDQFISVAEDSGLIYRLGDWVIEEACRIAAQILEEIDPEGFSLAINVSPRQFRQKAFSSTVLQAIGSSALPRGMLELELTERLLIDDVEDAARKMQLLRESGLRFSIDDFGTGYSSLRYLKSLPLDVLKVDQSFVRDVLTDPGDASIVRAIVSMARSLELQVIAEGVETREVHDFLVQTGCMRFQGFLYARPMPLEDFRALLREHARPAALAPPALVKGV